MKIIQFLFIFFIFSASLFAQSRLSGVVREAETGAGLPGVNIYIPQLAKGTTSDADGFFSIQELPKGSFKVQFSFIGYKTQVVHFQFSDKTHKTEVTLSPCVVHTQEVVVSGGTFSTQHENAIKIESIESEAIKNSGHPSFMENLSQVPGVSVISKGVGISKPVIRGLSMTNILLLNNGVRMENFQFSENHPFVVDEFGTEKIEIIKGPASLLYGSDAIGGVINLVKEKPAPVGTVQGDFSAQLHSNTRGIASSLGFKGTGKSLFWGLRASLKRHSDYKAGNGERVPNTRFGEESLKFFAGLNKKFGSFKWFYDYNAMRLGLCLPAALPLSTENGYENQVWYQDLTSHIVSSKNTLFLGQNKTEINLSFQQNDRLLSTSEAMPQFTMVNMRLQSFSYEAKSYLYSSERSDLIVGLQGLNRYNTNGDAPNHVLPDFQSFDFSGFALTKYRFGEKLFTQLGLRYDIRRINIPPQGDRTEKFEKKYHNISASLGATYQINPEILLRANVASAYRTPNIAELTQDGVHGQRYEQGNPTLESQRSYEADASFHFHNENTKIDAALFANRINHYIFLTPTGENAANGMEIFRYMQNPAMLYGGEAGLEVFPLNWLSTKAIFSYLRGKQDNGENLPFIPQHKLSYEIKFHSPKLGAVQQAFLKAQVEYVFEQNSPARFETDSPDYMLLAVSVGFDWQVKKQRLHFVLSANNLLNENYIDHLSTLKGLGYGNLGRNISLSVRVPFGQK